MLAMAGLFTLLGGLSVSAVLLSSAWTDLTGDRGYPAALRTYRLTAGFAPEFAGSTTLPDFRVYQFSAQALERIRSDISGVEDALLIAESGHVHRVGASESAVQLRTIASSTRFPDFFGLGLASDESGVWLTRSGAGRLRPQTGAMPAEVEIAGLYYPVLGVVADPPAGSHLQYEAILLSRAFSPERDGVIYIRTSSPAEVEGQLAPVLADDVGFPFLAARLEPVTGLRISAAPGLGDANFIVTGQGLELAVALFCGLSALCGTALAIGLLTSGSIATNRQKLGIRVMLGAAPKRLAFRILLLLGLAGAILALGAFSLSVVFGEPVLGALNKPDPTKLLQPIAAAFGSGLVLILLFAGLSLTPLATEAPARLALSGQARRRNTAFALVIGLAVLSTGSASLGFVAAQFSLEARRGAVLSLEDSRTWRMSSYDRAVIGRLVASAERSAFVDGYTVLNWYPFLDSSLNMPVALEGGALVQVSVLTGGMSWPQFVDADVVAGAVPERLWGAARHCEAVLETTAADQISSLGYGSQIGRNLVLADRVETCRIVAVIEPVRRGKLASHGDPVVHLTGVDLATTFNPQGDPYLSFLVRLKPGLVPSDVFDASTLSGLDSQILSIGELGQRAYERERRVASILNLASLVLMIVFLLVAVALSLQTFAAARSQIAIRLALGARPSRLAPGIFLPVFLSAVASIVSTSILTVFINGAWSSWGGLSRIDPMTRILAMGQASAVCVLPVLLVALICFVLISRTSPATVLRGS